MGSTLDFMRQKGINRDDFQSWGGVNNYGPQMSMPQMQSPFNPYSNSSGQGGVLTPYSGGRPTDVTGGDYMGGKGTGMPFAQRMGQLGIPAGLDDTMTPGIMAANAANQQKNAASRANTAANPASISDLSKRLGLMGGYGGNTSPQGMLTNRLEQPQGMRQIPQEMIEANKKAAALTALEAPTNYSAEYMRNMMKSPQGGGDYTGRGSFGNDMREAGPMGGGMDQLAVMPQQGEGGPDVNSPYFAGVGAMQKNNDALVAANRPPTFSDYGGPMGMMPQQSGFLPQMQNPFSFQQQSYQQQYNPYQMQLPFSYQHPLLGNGPKPVAQPAIPPNYGPTSPIISRSAGFRGTPNVMRRAEGGIASLMDDVE